MGLESPITILEINYRINRRLFFSPDRSNHNRVKERMPDLLFRNVLSHL